MDLAPQSTIFRCYDDDGDGDVGDGNDGDDDDDDDEDGDDDGKFFAEPYGWLRFSRCASGTSFSGHFFLLRQPVLISISLIMPV